eukprot:293804-Chlamydomonas_euryale.AAC.2
MKDAWPGHLGVLEQGCLVGARRRGGGGGLHAGLRGATCGGVACTCAAQGMLRAFIAMQRVCLHTLLRV